MLRKLSLRQKKKWFSYKKACKCFLWCHIRHLNRLKTHSERLKKSSIVYADSKLLASQKDYCKIE